MIRFGWKVSPEVYASPVGASGRVYLLGRDGNALVIENGPEFKILAQNSTR